LNSAATLNTDQAVNFKYVWLELEMSGVPLSATWQRFHARPKTL
jgi:hypothetical protein